MLQFAKYQPFPFNVSRKQELANLLSGAALVVSLMALFGLGLVLSRAKRDVADLMPD